MNNKCGWLLNNRLVEISADTVNFEYFNKLRQLLNIKKAEKYSLVRIGTPDKDGGYVMLNNFYKYGIAYSFGICDDINWDNDIANKGYNIFMYDHTVDKLPFERKEFHFHKNGISGSANDKLNTLEYFIEKNGHKNYNNMLLKMDVEGYEWDFLDTVNINILTQFDQIVIELHNLLQNNQHKLHLLEKLNQTHQLIHLHGNNCSAVLQIGQNLFPDTVEATYINNKNYTVIDTQINLPSPFDKPNDPSIADIILGNWNI